MVSGSQDNHPLIEGQFITYACPPGFILTGPNVSVCTGNRELEPDPGQVDCIGNATIITAHVLYYNINFYVVHEMYEISKLDCTFFSLNLYQLFSCS